MTRGSATRRVEAQERKPLREALIAALAEAEGDVSAVARRFAVDRGTVYAWMAKHGVEVKVVVEATGPTA